jgi:hypothetical protein
MVEPSALSVTVDLLEPGWLFAEREDNSLTAERVQAWAGELSEDLHGDEVLASWLVQTLQTLADSLLEDEIVAVHLPDVLEPPTIVRIRFAHETDDETFDLAELIRGETRETLEPPIVEPHRAASLGTGVRALRFRALGRDRELFGSLAFAFRQRDMVVTVVGDNPNFDVLVRRTDAMVRLIDAITITQQVETGHR